MNIRGKVLFLPRASPQPARSDPAPRRPAAAPPSAGERGRLRDGHGAAAGAGGRESGHGRRGKARREEGQALSGSCRACRSPEARRRRAEAASEGLALRDWPSANVPQRGSLKEGPLSDCPSKNVAQRWSLSESPCPSKSVPRRGSHSDCPPARLPTGWAVLWHCWGRGRRGRRVGVTDGACPLSAVSQKPLPPATASLEVFWEAQ